MNDDAGITALVPMKGHSKRVPSKNVRLFGGKPLFFHILDSLMTAKSIREILVDTDSPEIKGIIKKSFPDVKIIDRPGNLVGDEVPMTAIIEHDVKYVASEHFFQTHSTNPLLRSSTIDRAVQTYFDELAKGYDSVMAVTRHQARFYDANMLPVNHDPGWLIPTQNLSPLYEDNSNFYINSVANILKSKNRVGSRPYLVEVSRLESIDIDEEEDFQIAEAMYYLMKNMQWSASRGGK